MLNAKRLNIQMNIYNGRVIKTGSAHLKRKLSRSVFNLQGFMRKPSDNDPQTFLVAPTKTKDIQYIFQRTRSTKRSQLKHLIIVGIGGSNLGARAILEALIGPEEWGWQHQTRCWWVETVEPFQTQGLLEAIKSVNSPNELAIVVISKSGSTLETVANAAVLIRAAQHRWPKTKLPIHIVTDQQSPIMRVARRERWEAFEIPKGIGGRFSVFSAAGLVPLALAGIDIKELCKGARRMLEQCTGEATANLAFRSALWLLLASRSSSIHDTFVFRPHFEALAQWYRQLQGESLGKPFGVKKKTWMTPTTSVGTQDLHSVLQLYLTDSLNRVTTFLFAPERGTAVPSSPLPDVLKIPPSLGIGEIQEAIYASVLQTYRANRQPFLDVTFSSLSPRTIGAFLQWKMIETVLIADTLGVNAFNQPAVESYKVRARTILKLP